MTKSIVSWFWRLKSKIKVPGGPCTPSEGPGPPACVPERSHCQGENEGAAELRAPLRSSCAPCLTLGFLNR